MNLGRLILREISYRKLNFFLGVLSVLVAVGTLTAQLGFLDEKRAETSKRMKEMQNAYRKIGVNLGFNLLILPKDQNLADLYANDFASKDMPEKYASDLAQARVLTVNHVLPTLQRKLKWPEKERTIILVGTRGEVYIRNPKRQKPILETVPPGTMVVGHELHRSMKLEKGQKVKLMDREFTVHQLEPEKGTKDDITIWINLAEAQELLDKKGRINGILALGCGCEADRLPKIRKEISDLLPDTQIVEFASQAVARAEARNRAALEAKKAEEDEAGHAAIVIPVVVLAAALWIGFLMLINVRERRNEIGILRAIGLSNRQILMMILGKAFLIGTIGAVLGCLAGEFFAISRAQIEVPFNLLALVLVVLAAPIVAGLASWLPALMAAQQDPALILREG